MKKGTPLSRKCLIFIGILGVADGARTHDNRNHNPGLYQLSYSHLWYCFSSLPRCFLKLLNNEEAEF